MKSIKTFVIVSALSLVSFASFAQTISATASTLDDAEAQIATIAQQNSEHYTILAATGQNKVHITAELTK
jgi:Tfp pilus assembly protein PilE